MTARFKYVFITLCLTQSLGFTSWAQEAKELIQVDVNLDVAHIVGGISNFDRSKFITLHATHTEPDWDMGTNAVGDLREAFLETYDVYLGRDTGAISWQLGQVAENPEKPGFASPDDMKQKGEIVKMEYANRPDLHPFEVGNTLIVGAQNHPFWPDGTKTSQGWALSIADTADEPFGTATGDYMGQWLSDFFGEGGSSGEPLPQYVEVMNEPIWNLVDYEKTATVDKVFTFHNAVAKAIRQYQPDIQIGGYAAAFPEFDKNNFGDWKERWQRFIDLAGENMDFFSVHLYDFPTTGQEKYRKGGQIEATLDMLETYSHIKLGEVKPLIISEYGSQLHNYFNQPWSAERDWLILKAVNSMMIQFMERPDVILKTIPFITLKAEWGRISPDVPYYWRLMRRENEPESDTGDWVYTDLVKFYELWSEVNGTRVDTYASDPDILVDAYVNDNKLYLILNSLEFEEYKLNLNLFGAHENKLEEVHIKHLYLKDQVPVLESSRFEQAPDTFTLGAEATAILTYTFSQPVQIDQHSEEVKYYPESYLERINPNQARVYHFNNVNLGENGEAVLRLGISRNHYVSFQPTITINGTAVEVPEDFRGYDQQHWGRFFGVIEVPVPYSILATNNEINIAFPDSTGFISTVILQVFKFSKEIVR